jgi:hypothetical protein
MGSREDLLSLLWERAINSNLDTDVLEQRIAASKARPDDPFADCGPALERLLALGADRNDICLLLREAAYTAVFSTLYSIGDPGVDGDDVFMLHEQLLIADPSGMDGRPVSSAAA